MLQILKLTQELDQFIWTDKEEDLCICIQMYRHVWNCCVLKYFFPQSTNVRQSKAKYQVTTFSGLEEGNIL